MSADHRQRAEEYLTAAEEHPGDSYEEGCVAKAQLHATLAVHDELRRLVAMGAQR